MILWVLKTHKQKKAEFSEEFGKKKSSYKLFETQKQKRSRELVKGVREYYSIILND